VPGVLKGASDSKTIQSRAEGELLGDDGVGGGVELSCEKRGEEWLWFPCSFSSSSLILASSRSITSVTFPFFKE
jgi:hypothetical protein